MGFGNLSISRVDGASAVRPRIAEAQTERAKPERARGASEAAGTVSSGVRGAERSRYRSRSSEEGSLTLTTAEGDKVTISFKNSQTAKVDQARLYGPNGGFESTRVKTRETAQLSVSLEGSLSEAELKDITDLVAKLSSGISAARGGDVQGAQQQLSEPKNLSSIESYSFAYQQSSSESFKAGFPASRNSARASLQSAPR
ncbi:MAG: hypothetical protein FJW36_05510 [Acidobacteria bacterium]|nr:hypothetical protein [Acidobacteriota bacterium]